MKRAEFNGQTGWYDEDSQEFFASDTWSQAEYGGKTGLYNKTTSEFIESQLPPTPTEQSSGQTLTRKNPIDAAIGMVQNAPQDATNILTGVGELTNAMATHPIDTLAKFGEGIGGSIYDFTHQPRENMNRLQATLQAQAKDPSLTIKSAQDDFSRAADFVEQNPVSAALTIVPVPKTGIASKVATQTLKRDSLTGGIAKQFLGATTGAGPGAIEEALKASASFKKAMRGQISGKEIVENAHTALRELRNIRGKRYRAELDKIANMQGPSSVIDFTNVATTLNDEIQNYFRVRNGVIDWDRPKVNPSAAKDIREIYDYVEKWGSKSGDLSPVGMDELKRYLDDFYSESSQARAFVAKMRKSVHNSISSQVPEYAEMTKAYAEATDLIKDIESNLMLRKQGMSGRITADSTLRRLSSAMRESFEMRRDLLQALSNQGGVDLGGQVAGYLMHEGIPRGLFGKLAGSSMAYFAYLHPKFWPIIAASSPRVVGEFLSVYGKALKYTPIAAKATAAAGVGNLARQAME